MRKYWVSLLALLLLAGCQQAPQAFVIPVAEEVSNTAAFAVTVPEGKKVALYVEHWLDGEQVERKHLVSFAEDTKPVVVQVNEQDGQVEYLYVTQSGDVQETVEQVHLEGYTVQGMSLWSWLTPEEAAAEEAQKAAKAALSGFVPVVGGILADAAEAVAAGAGALRSAVGLLGLLTVLAICILPFLRLGAHYLIYKLSAALCATVCPGPVAALVDDIGSAFALLMGLVGGGGFILYVALITSVKAVVG